MISSGGFFIILNFSFFRLLGGGGVKGQKIAPNEKEQLHPSSAISQEQYTI